MGLLVGKYNATLDEIRPVEVPFIFYVYTYIIIYMHMYMHTRVFYLGLLVGKYNATLGLRANPNARGDTPG